METEGSLRNSHREMSAVKRKRTPNALHEQVKLFVENSLSSHVIRKLYNPEKMSGILANHPFYVMENDGKGEPGFLVCLPSQPAVFFQFRKKGVTSCVLRMRIHDRVREGGGSIFVATFDDILHSFRFEDVWIWRGEKVFDGMPYSKRRVILEEFLTSCWVPDARLLGGVTASVANPISIAEWLQRGATSWAVEFIPEKAGCSRIWMPVVAKVAPAQVPVATLPAPAPAPAPVVAVPAPAPVQPSRRVRAVALESLPDVFEIYGEDGLPIGRASVQNYTLSQQIRGKSDIWVIAEWAPSFGGYIIKTTAK
jgi:hypothetical protein